MSTTLTFKPGPGPAVNQPIVLFDLGNILVHLRNVDQFWPGLKPEPGTLPFAERWKNSAAMQALETGRLDDFGDFYRQAKQEMGFPIGIEEFRQGYLDIIGEPFAETIPVLQALSGHFSLQLLSNTSGIHWRHCRETLGLGPFFDRVFVSYELGVMKPDPLIFQLALQETDQEPETIYYFDDRPENIKTALKFGINAHLSWGGAQLIRQLRELKFLL